MYFYLVLLTLLVLHQLYKALTRDLDKLDLPGPSLNMFNRFRMTLQYKFMYTVPEFADYWLSRYGRTVQVNMLGKHTILTSDQTLIKEVLTGTWAKHFTSRMGSEQGLKQIGMLNSGVIWNNDKHKWKLSRKAFENNFTSKYLDEAAHISCQKMKQQIDRLNSSAAIRAVKDNTLNYEINLLGFFRRVTLSIVLQVK